MAPQLFLPPLFGSGRPLQDRFRADLADNEPNGIDEIPEFIEGDSSVDDQMCFGGYNRWKNQARTVAEGYDRITELQSLQVLRLARSTAHRHFLRPKKCIDDRAFPDIGVSHKAYDASSGAAPRRHAGLQLVQQPAAVRNATHPVLRKRTVRRKTSGAGGTLRIIHMPQLLLCVAVSEVTGAVVLLDLIRFLRRAIRGSGGLLLLELPQGREEDSLHAPLFPVSGPLLAPLCIQEVGLQGTSSSHPLQKTPRPC